MEGILSDTLQRMPPLAASPGLPPVDPVKASLPDVADVVPRVAAQAGNVAGAPVRPRESNPRGGPSPADEVAIHASTGGEGQAERVTGVGQEDAPFSEGNPSSDAADPCVHPGAGGSATEPAQGSGEGSANEYDLAVRRSGEPVPPFTIEAYEHSSFVFAKDAPASPSPAEAGLAYVGTEPTGPSMAPPGLAVDTRAGDRLPRAGTPARPGRRVPPRVATRPRTEEWADDELLTLPEAAALFWPDGPITVSTLRTAERDGTLMVTKVAGKFFTTPLAIRRMGLDGGSARPVPEMPDEARTSAQAQFQRKLDEARKLGRDRKRRQRSAKRPAAPVDDGGARQ